MQEETVQVQEEQAAPREIRVRHGTAVRLPSMREKIFTEKNIDHAYSSET